MQSRRGILQFLSVHTVWSLVNVDPDAATQCADPNAGDQVRQGARSKQCQPDRARHRGRGVRMRCNLLNGATEPCGLYEIDAIVGKLSKRLKRSDRLEFARLL